MCEGKITQLHLEHIKQFTWWTILRGSLTSVHAQCPRIKWRLCGAQKQLWTYTFPGTTKTYRLQQTQTQTVFKSSALDTEPWLNNALHPQTKLHIMRNKNGKKQLSIWCITRIHTLFLAPWLGPKTLNYTGRPWSHHVHYLVTQDFHVELPTVFWHCWLGDRNGIQPVELAFGIPAWSHPNLEYSTETRPAKQKGKQLMEGHRKDKLNYHYYLCTMHSWQTSLHYYLRVPRINKKNTQGLLQDFQKPLSSVPLFGLAKYFWIVLLSQSNWKQKPSRF